MSETKRRLPSGWRWVRLRDLVRKADTGFACGQRAGGGTIQLRMNNIAGGAGLDMSSVVRVPADRSTVAAYQLQTGDVVFNNTNSVELVGKTALFEGFDEPVLFSNHITRLRTEQSVLEPAFLAAWLQAQWYERYFALICHRWIGQSAVQRERLLEIDVPLAPINEQRRLAGALRCQSAAIERARAAAAAQLAGVDALPAALLRKAFSGVS